ncbi:MAG: alkaline phosphatase [Desulfobacterales bacterium]|jgi:alkaline phosphatase
MTSKKIFRYAPVAGGALLLAAILATAAFAGAKFHANNAQVRNVIVMVPDGCAQSIQTLARWVKGAPLNLDGLNTGTVKTYMADSIITDSASAATAFATGHKTSNGYLGVGPNAATLLTGFVPTADPFRPVASVLEGAKRNGMATGLVATSRISHATPAAFAAHLPDRNLDNEIMEQMVYQDIEVVFGGGARHLIPEGSAYTTTFGDNWHGKRTDKEDLIRALRDRGYAFVDNRNDMMGLTRGPVWGLFDDSHLDPDIDRDDLHPTQPSLAEMTDKAIALLSANRKGFFLMVEGSQVDWAGHANDPAYMATEFLAFDEAVKKAVDFAQYDKHTLVLVFPDHNTGALSLGHQQSGFPPAYTATKIEDLIDPIKDAQVTIQTLVTLYPSNSPADVRNTFVKYWGDYWNKMTDDQAQAILDLGTDSYAVSEYISKNLTVFGWTTHGHTGEDVPLWAFGPQRPIGTFDNTELAEIIAGALGFDLARVTERLFVDVAEAFPGFTVDDTDPANLVLKIDGCQLPVSKDILKKGGRENRLGGIVVHAPAIDKFFIPMEAVQMIR